MSIEVTSTELLARQVYYPASVLSILSNFKNVASFPELITVIANLGYAVLVSADFRTCQLISAISKENCNFSADRIFTNSKLSIRKLRLKYTYTELQLMCQQK